MAKGRAVESTEQCTHAKRGKQVPGKSVSSTLLELTEKAKRERKYRFRSLYREIDLRMLYDSFMLLKPVRRQAWMGWTGTGTQKTWMPICPIFSNA